MYHGVCKSQSKRRPSNQRSIKILYIYVTQFIKNFLKFFMKMTSELARKDPRYGLRRIRKVCITQGSIDATSLVFAQECLSAKVNIPLSAIVATTNELVALLDTYAKIDNKKYLFDFDFELANKIHQWIRRDNQYYRHYRDFAIYNNVCYILRYAGIDFFTNYMPYKGPIIGGYYVYDNGIDNIHMFLYLIDQFNHDLSVMWRHNYRDNKLILIR